MDVQAGMAVWYWPGHEDVIPAVTGRPLTAQVALVLDPVEGAGCRLNLSVCDVQGRWHSRENALFVPEGAEKPDGKSFCEFTPWTRPVAAEPQPVPEARADDPPAEHPAGGHKKEPAAKGRKK